MATTFSGPLRNPSFRLPEELPNCTLDELAFELSYLPVVTDQVNLLIRGDVKACNLKVEGHAASLQGPVGRIVIFRCDLSHDQWARYIHSRWSAFCADTILALLPPAQASA